MLQKRDQCPTSLWETKGSRDKAFVNAPEEGPMPHVIVGDKAFPLKTCLLRPYPGKNLTGDQVIFNYRLSRARRIVENAFGILLTRFRVYQRRIQLSPGHTQSMIQATIVLHNYLQKTSAGATPDDCANRQGRPKEMETVCATSAVLTLAHQTKRPRCETLSRSILCRAVQWSGRGFSALA